MSHPILDQIITSTHAKQNGSDQWLGHCPAHGSRQNRDLSIALRDDKILLNCFAACQTEAVCGALGLGLTDLFLTARTTPNAMRPRTPSKPVDRAHIAFQFELGALDRRMRAERVLEQASGQNCEVTDNERDTLMGIVARAYEDLERAEWLEGLADHFREYSIRQGKAA
ncbi:MAG: hypothetical protein H8K03_20410 [Nitrospira sp.]